MRHLPAIRRPELDALDRPNPHVPSASGILRHPVSGDMQGGLAP
jgi:hypothetical protein